MRILKDGLDLEAFFERLSTARERLLLLDYDGTLAPFRNERDQAAPYPKIRGVLDAIVASRSCRIVIISGRAIADLMPLLGLKHLPEIWGCHGWERRTADGEYLLSNLTDALKAGLAEAASWAVDAGVGERLERKPAGVAVHWRGMPEREIESLREKVAARWGLIAEASGLELLGFNGGLELRAPGRDKGYAVKTLLAESGPEAVAAYLGDDLTDEDAFKALAGRGLRVFVNVTLRPTVADMRIEPPDELMEFLERWHAACGGADDGQ